MVITVKIAGAVIISNAKGQVDCFVNIGKVFTLPPRSLDTQLHFSVRLSLTYTIIRTTKLFENASQNSRRNLKTLVLRFNSVNGEHFENEVFRKFFVVVRTENL